MNIAHIYTLRKEFFVFYTFFEKDINIPSRLQIDSSYDISFPNKPDI